MATANYSKAYADYMNQRNEINRKATLDALLQGLDQNIAQANANRERQEAEVNRAITENENNYQSTVKDTRNQYQNLVDQVQAQRYNNERVLNERNARLYGLNDSGVSRTNALKNSMNANNRTTDLLTQREATLQNLLNQRNLKQQEYKDAIRNLSNDTDAAILGYRSDYNNNLARVNAQYDANILPWYDEPVDNYYYSYSGGGRTPSSPSSNGGVGQRAIDMVKAAAANRGGVGQRAVDMVRSVANNRGVGQRLVDTVKTRRDLLK